MFYLKIGRNSLLEFQADTYAGSALIECWLNL
jgi:hypothetical protein